ncbi:hypothetical protein MSAN_02428000 [Mycena sanguinolenta]|uniref:Uncharacterized protein n=1 Tax=Mycena sanguinolenta TaxID=230812 RepID=A0A8H7CF55_9AGAR|nr:hypothetical protein MSAN_02428000 [Mycena sanguinolenta]
MEQDNASFEHGAVSEVPQSTRSAPDAEQHHSRSRVPHNLGPASQHSPHLDASASNPRCTATLPSPNWIYPHRLEARTNGLPVPLADSDPRASRCSPLALPRAGFPHPPQYPQCPPHACVVHVPRRPPQPRPQRRRGCHSLSGLSFRCETTHHAHTGADDCHCKLLILLVPTPSTPSPSFHRPPTFLRAALIRSCCCRPSASEAQSEGALAAFAPENENEHKTSRLLVSSTCQPSAFLDCVLPLHSAGKKLKHPALLLLALVRHSPARAVCASATTWRLRPRTLPFVFEAAARPPRTGSAQGRDPENTFAPEGRHLLRYARMTRLRPSSRGPGCFRPPTPPRASTPPPSRIPHSPREHLGEWNFRQPPFALLYAD